MPIRLFFNTLIILLVPLTVISQGIDNYWFFGGNAGLDFSTGTPVAITTGALYTGEGCASISDNAGNLLFYTDGRTVYNKNHVIMANGSGLRGNQTSTQAATIIKKPGSTTVYYMVAIGNGGISFGVCPYDTTTAFNGTPGVWLNEIDMSLNAGLGAVTNRNIFLSNCHTEGGTAIKHCNNKDAWFVLKQRNSGELLCFSITSAGFNTVPAVYDVGLSGSKSSNLIGSLKSSHDGKKLVYLYQNYGTIELFDFDNATGVISNGMAMHLGNTLGQLYGLEFSPNNKILYLTDNYGYNFTMQQFDLCAGDTTAIKASMLMVGSGYGPNAGYGQLQLGPDKRIYHSSSGNSALGVIQNPNILGTGCNFVHNFISLGTKNCFLGLPDFLLDYNYPAPLPINTSINCLDVDFSIPGNAFTIDGCIPENFTATAFSWDFGDPTSGASNTSITQNPKHIYSSAGTYTVTATVQYNCYVDTLRSEISVASCACSLTASVSSVNTVSCNNQNDGSVVIGIANASGGTYTYSWTNGTTAGSTSTTTAPYLINSLAAGTYTITVTDGGCSGTSTFTITEPGLLTSSLTVVNGSCNSLGNITATISGGTGAYTYLWSNGASAITTSTTNQLPNLSTQSYTLTITDSNGCISTISANINNGAGVNITSATQVEPNCFGENTGSASVSATSGATLYTYSWSNGASTITTSTTSDINGLIAQTYTVTITDDNLCSATTVITIANPQQLIAQIIITNTSCGLNNGTLDVTTSGGDGNYNYSWSSAQTTKQINNVVANTYTITVTDGKGCIASSSGVIGISTSPLATINANPTTIVEGGETSILTAGGGIAYQWKPSATLSCATCQSPIALPLVTTTYTLIVTDINGCIDSTDIVITVKPACIGSEEDVYIANVFSPNGDGQNDVLYIKGNGLENINWAIYDRWGNKLFETNSQAEGWNGTADGKALGAGTYVYYLKATCKKTNREVVLKGNVSIVK